MFGFFRRRAIGRSKIFITIVYLWTGRGPEINNGRSAVTPGSFGRVVVALDGTGRGPIQQLASAGVIVAEAVKRRRARQAVSRPKVVQFSLTEEEFEEVSGAASRSGLARGAFAAEVTLAAARGVGAPAPSPLRDGLVEVMTAAGLVRRVGTNLNPAVAKLNATGQRADDLLPATELCVRVIRRLDEAAEQLSRSIP